MKISLNNFVRVSEQVGNLSRRLRSAAGTAISPIDGSFSSVNGVGDVGTIHQRVIATDPGSASNSLRSFDEQIEWLSNTLVAEARGFESQDLANSRGLDIADAGGSVTGEAMPVMNQPDPGYSPFGFVMPVVNVGSDLFGLAMDLLNTKIWSVSETNSRWRFLSSEVAAIVDGLNEVASSLESENDSEATARAAQKIRMVAESGNHFIANAEVMSQKLFGFQANLMASQPKAMGLAMSAMAIPDPAARKAAEQAGLAFMQSALQTQVVAAMPFQHPLMTTMPPSGGGDVSTDFGGVNGSGQRYSTANVAWPKHIAEAILRGELGPGSFGIVNGKVEGLEGLGMSDADIQKFNNDLVTNGRNTLAELGAGGFNPIAAGDVGTRGASVNLAPVAPGGAGAGMGMGPGVGAGALGGAPSLASGSGATLNPATMTAGAGATGGLGAGAGTGPMMGAFGGVPALAGSASVNGQGHSRGQGLGLGASNAGGRGAGRLGPVGPGGAFSAGGVGGTGGIGGAGLAGSAGSTAAPSARTGALGAGGVGGPGNTAGTAAAGVNSARGAGNTRGAMGGRMMPLMAGTGQGGGQDRRIKSVTSKVERDPNRRDLLGEPPAALPGVIGAWAREES